MKLVEGRDLANLLAERPSPGHDVPRFLGIFEQVCQAVAYAHSRGVINRDLKPKNVMVGAFAEVQVMDWGFAKVLLAEGTSQEPLRGETQEASPGGQDTIRTVRTEATGLSSADGLVMGTFAYMSPEQAQGQVEQLDPRADVFGLGALLCEVLTGLPPYAGVPAWKLHQMAAAGDLADAFARLDRCGADAELIALARDCLAPERERRPRDAGAVVERLATYLAEVQERLRRAEVEKGAAQARAEEAQATARAERRARRLTVGLAAAVLALVLLAAGGVVWLQRQAEDRRRGVAAALEKADLLQRQARWAEARAVLEQAESRLGEGEPAELHRRLDQARRDLDLVARFDAIRLKRATIVGGKFDDATADGDYAAAFRKAGLGAVGDDPGEVAARVRGSGVRAELVAALDDWAANLWPPGPRLSWVLAVARGADPDPWRDRVRDPRVWNNKRRLARLAKAARVREVPPRFAGLVGMRLQWLGGDAEALLRAAQGRRPGDFWVNFYLGHALFLKQSGEAVGYYRAALALRPGNPVVLNNLGNALSAQGKRAEAVREYRRAIALNPKFAPAFTNLGNALYGKQELHGAIAAHKKAIALDPKRAVPYNNLGNALKAQGDRASAIAAYKMAITLDPSYAMPHYNLGNTLFASQDFEGAVAEYQQAIALDPRYAPAHNNLGHALKAKQDLIGAIAAYKQALTLAPNYVVAYNNLGNALKSMGDMAGAIAAHKKAIDIDPSYGRGYFILGVALHDKGDLAGAIAAYQKAIDIDPKDFGAHLNLGTVLNVRGDVKRAIVAFEKALALNPKDIVAWNGLGTARKANGDLGGAIAAYQKAIDLDRTCAKAYVNLGNALLDMDNLKQAIAALRKAIAIEPNNGDAHYNLANALKARGDLTGAIAEFQTAIKINPKDVHAFDNLGNALHDKGDLAGAIAAHQKAVKIGPKDGTAHFNLGNALFAARDLKGAIVAYEKAIALNPKDVQACTNVGNARKALGDLNGAIAAYRKAIEIDPKLADAYSNLGNALYVKGNLDEAIAAYRKAIVIDPNHLKTHANLGVALHVKRDLEGAIAQFRKALAINRKFVNAHVGLAEAFLAQGRFADGSKAARRALDILPSGHPFRKTALQQIERAKRLLEFNDKLSAILKGGQDPTDAAELLNLAIFCLQYKQRYAAATRFYVAAFAEHPQWAQDSSTHNRYNAACAASLAAGGEGNDAGKLADKERAKLRQQALSWLKQDLKAWTGLAQKGPPQARVALRQALQHWQTNPGLSSLRDNAALANLPEQERKAWQQLWADVAKLLKKAGAGKKGQKQGQK
jgi:tetratricopeptide (TPR) repeat protein